MADSRTLAIGDIHGAYKALLQVIEKASVTEADTIIFLGDYVDGWSESPQVLNFLIELSSRHHCIFLKGNHDELFLDWLINGIENRSWLKHGGVATIKAYQAVAEPEKKKHIHFIEQLVDYYKDDSNRLFLHAGFTHIKGIDYEYFPRAFYWDRSLWETALALNPALDEEDPRYPSRLKIYREIFIGHTPTVRLGSSKPINAANVWNLDTGAAFDGQLTIMDVNSKEYWQSDQVETLYPDESARTMF